METYIYIGIVNENANSIVEYYTFTKWLSYHRDSHHKT